MNELFRRLRYLLNRRRLEEELAGEMEFHREMAARAAGLPLGNALQLREEAREVWGWTWLDRLSQDLRYALRLLLRSPGFTIAAVLILAIGIGANVAAFGFFNLIVLRPLPVRDPATLVRFQRQSPKSYASVLPYPEMAFFREHARTLLAVLAWTPGTLTIGPEAKPVRAHFATANLFHELGARPLVGRLLDPSRDDAASAEPVVVFSRGFWERYFGGDSSIAGKVVYLNGKPVIVAGVADENFSDLSLNTVDAWLPITEQPYFIAGSKLLTEYAVEAPGVTVWGRLQRGATPKMAEEELSSLAAILRKEHPNDIWENESLPAQAGAYASATINQGHHGTGTRDPDRLVPIAATAGTLVLLILTVACTNLGSLLLARGVAREREMSIRAAVGAGHTRLIRQLFTESLLLGALGSLAGLGLGYLVLRGLMAISGTPAWLNPAPDWRVMLFAAGAGLLSTIVFGLAPAVQIVRHRHRATRMRQSLVAAQVAAGCILLVVAGLLVRALTHAMSDPGFTYERLVAINPDLANHGYMASRADAYMKTLKTRLRELPGVEAVSFTDKPPFGRRTVTVGADVTSHVFRAHLANVDPQYFETLQISIVRGVNLRVADSHSIVVSRSLARAAWPGQDPLGRTLPLGGIRYQVAGIAADARVASDQETNMIYGVVLPSDMPTMVAVVRTASAPEVLARNLLHIAKAIDPRIVPDVRTIRSFVNESLDSKKDTALTAGVLAILALLLACLGIMGLVAYTVSQRAKELAIRLALGAKPAQILAVVLRQLSLPVLAGLLLGLAGAAALSRLLDSLLFGIGRLDPAAYLGAIVFFAVSVALACVGPARRALRLDPARVLRSD